MLFDITHSVVANIIQSANAHSARPEERLTEGRRRFVVSSFVVSLFLLFWCLVVSLFGRFVVLSFRRSLFRRFVVRCVVVLSFY